MWIENSIYKNDLEKIVQDRNIEWQKFQNKAILITGANGLIGSNLVNALLYANEIFNLNCKILALVRNEEKAIERFKKQKNENLKFIISDIRERIECDEKIDYIIHAASQTSSKKFIEDAINTIDISISGTKNVLEFAKKNKITSMVFLSTMEVYGRPSTDEKINESHATNIDTTEIRNCYPISKRMCENLCIAYASQYGLPVKIARLSQTFGAGILEGENRVFAQFARSAIRNQDIVLHTKGLSEGNYCYLRDTLWALIVILMKGAQSAAYNVSNEESHTTIADMAAMVCSEIADNRIKVIFDIPESNQYGYAADTRMKLNTDRLKALGWEPEIGLKESYQRLIRSMTFNGDIE